MYRSLSLASEVSRLARRTRPAPPRGPHTRDRTRHSGGPTHLASESAGCAPSSCATLSIRRVDAPIR